MTIHLVPFIKLVEIQKLLHAHQLFVLLREIHQKKKYPISERMHVSYFGIFIEASNASMPLKR